MLQRDLKNKDIGMELTFRRATVEDVPGIIALCNECFSERTNVDSAIWVFNATSYDTNQIYLNGEFGGRIIAHAKITVIQTIYGEMGTYAVLNHVCVKPEYRRQHIATALLNEIVKICKTLGCKRMCLWSKNFRTDAHEFYKKLGFELLEAGFFQKDI